jgi:hypothetical protein
MIFDLQHTGFWGGFSSTRQTGPDRKWSRAFLRPEGAAHTTNVRPHSHSSMAASQLWPAGIDVDADIRAGEGRLAGRAGAWVGWAMHTTDGVPGRIVSARTRVRSRRQRARAQAWSPRRSPLTSQNGAGRRSAGLALREGKLISLLCVARSERDSSLAEEEGQQCRQVRRINVCSTHLAQTCPVQDARPHTQRSGHCTVWVVSREMGNI